MMGAQTVRNHYGEHLAFRGWYARPERREFTPQALRWLDPELPHAAAWPENWLFLDTETTGLSAATSSYAFLIGLAWWDAGGLQVEQLFMRDPSEEHSVLMALKERLAERNILVTFNGKTFDWPLLETRLRMTRSITPRMPRGHLDMLHPARQLWRPRLRSVKLTELERHVLGVPRDEDVLSALIPGLYFDFLRGGAAEPIFRVLRHNRMDLQGLAALLQHALGRLSSSSLTTGTATLPIDEDPVDIFARARFFLRRGASDLARPLFHEALARGLPAADARAALLHLARIAKTDGDFTLAFSLWEELCSGATGYSREKLDACEQLAIHHEHRARKPERAAEIVRAALASLSEDEGDAHSAISAAQSRRWQLRFANRLGRLSAKQCRAQQSRAKHPRPPPGITGRSCPQTYTMVRLGPPSPRGGDETAGPEGVAGHLRA
jgi:uncharacterized protein YprB with RNaseH-like and TPR domain